jgi:hypothetical protein
MRKPYISTIGSLVPGIGTFFMLVNRGRYIRTLAASQEFAKLLGDAERHLDRAVDMWEDIEPGSAEASRIRSWKERMESMVREYSVDIGQSGHGAGNR